MEPRLPAGTPRQLRGLVAEHGRPYESAKLTRVELRIVEAAIAEHRRVHEKFDAHGITSSQLVLANDGSNKLIYGRRLALIDRLPLPKHV